MQYSKEKLNKLKREDWYQIAKIIDTEYIGSKDSFTCNYINYMNNGFYYLTTNKCDDASMIKVYSDKICRLANDTNGYEEIQKQTYKNIDNYIKEIKCKK